MMTWADAAQTLELSHVAVGFELSGDETQRRQKLALGNYD
jgi:hypothetical protein